MDDILEQVKGYDLKTLRQKLQENGIKVGPIAPSTASLFQKRLAKHYFLQQGGVLDDEPDSSNVSTQCTSPLPVVKETKQDDAPKESDVFYAVCLPHIGNTEDEERQDVEQLVFSDKKQALQLAKKIKGSRFKVFKTEQEAQEFSKFTAETAFQSPRRLSKEESNEEKPVFNESSPFKAPKPQDLVALRKVIEAGNGAKFKEHVLNNPRFLVSSGDTPAIYQEGPRYTAMHVAALKNKPEICQTILDLLEDESFIFRLYAESKNSEQTLIGRINFLVDLYLNMPDKGNCESPLHMACKFGHDKVVEVLTAHPRTDKFLKNKYGETPKDIICSRVQTSSAELKKKIETLLQGQYYVPLIRSDDNTSAPVIGQPWSPDISKGVIDAPRVASSPRDPSMAVRACAGPMSPVDASKFHKRWTTPPSQGPEKAEYFNTKRSDSEKGMERIGRKLAIELNVPWSEYWDFLDQFIDLTSDNGLDILEEYFRKRVWIQFTKDFKEKHCIVDENFDPSLFNTPVIHKTKQTSEQQTTKPDSCNNGAEIETKDREVGKKVNEKDENENAKDEVKDGGLSTSVSSATGSDIVSPMTNLAKNFEKLQLLDDSWSEQATVATSSKSECNSEGSSIDSNVTSESHVTVDKEGSGIGKEGVTAMNTQNEKSNTPVVNDTVKESESVIKTENGLKEHASDKLKDEPDSVSVDSYGLDIKGTLLNPKLKYQRLRSISSGSSGSFETAREGSNVSSSSYCSQLSTPGENLVCVRLQESQIFKTLEEYANKVSEDYGRGGVCFILQWKPYSSKTGQKVSLISLPVLESAKKLLLMEHVDVASCDGDITKVAEGEVIEIGTSGALDVEKDSLLAYLTRAETLPKCGYIHGPHPTREDLNVSRALGNTLITPDRYPNVFHWKISLSRFLRDTNYRWQSPVKLKPKRGQLSPHPSPLRKTSPVIQYGSPLGLEAPVSRNGYITSGIRTKLFPSISE